MKRVLLFVMLSALLLSMSGCTTVKSNMDDYDDYVASVGAGDFMPKLDSLGKYIETATNYSKHKPINPSDCVELFVVYSKNDYEKKKEALLKQYTFLKEAVPGDSDEDWLMPVTSADVNGYTIMVVDNRAVDKTYSFPKHFGMVGYNDEMNAVVYLFFSGDKLDKVKSLPEFIEKNFVFEAR